MLNVFRMCLVDFVDQ